MKKIYLTLIIFFVGFLIIYVTHNQLLILEPEELEFITDINDISLKEFELLLESSSSCQDQYIILIEEKKFTESYLFRNYIEKSIRSWDRLKYGRIPVEIIRPQYLSLDLSELENDLIKRNIINEIPSVIYIQDGSIQSIFSVSDWNKSEEVEVFQKWLLENLSLENY